VYRPGGGKQLRGAGGKYLRPQADDDEEEESSSEEDEEEEEEEDAEEPQQAPPSAPAPTNYAVNRGGGKQLRAPGGKYLRPS
jgi:hypothetical protein